MVPQSGGVRGRLEELDPRAVRPGLRRIRALLEALEAPHLRYPTAVIGGTNGKGSVAAMLAAIGRAAGHRIGFYSSPHLVDLEERLRVNGQPIMPSGLDGQLGRVFEAVDELVADRHLEEPPSHFEVLTAAAFNYFAEAHVDLAVLEVGLGGRWDATNVTRPRVGVLTSIAVDHVEFLGSDLRTIAAEKAAIIPAAGLGVVAPQAPEVMEVLARTAEAEAAVLWRSEDFPVMLRRSDERLRFTIDCVGRLRDYVGLELALPGLHQVDNARCAILAAEALDRRRLRIGSDAIWAGLRSVRWPGRCEWLDEAPPVLLDAAHNPAAAEALAEYLWELRRRRAYDRLHLVFGAMQDKDVEGMGRVLLPLADTLVATRPPLPRAAPAERILEVGSHPQRRSVAEDPAEALDRARNEAAPEDLVCVTGSAYLVGALRPRLLD